MREFKLKNGETVVFETDGETVWVICSKCGWKDWQTFFIENFTENDIGRKCPDCDIPLNFKVPK
jgi:hypothetical protein